MHVLHVQVPQNGFSEQLYDGHFPAQIAAQRRRPGDGARAGTERTLPLANIAEQKLIAAMNRGLARSISVHGHFQLQEEAARVSIDAADGVDPQQAAKYISTNPEAK